MPLRVNMATSLDGRIAPASREKVRLGTDEDIRRMDTLRAWADAVVVGAGTLRAEDPPMGLRDEELLARRRETGGPEQPALVVVTRSMEVPADRAFRTGGRVIVAAPASAPEPPDEIAAAAEVWRIGEAAVDPLLLTERLEAEGLERVLLEGGGALAAHFFDADLVDELYVTITPWLLGGEEAPTMADLGRPMDPPARFELVDMDVREDEVFLRYVRTGQR
ncbi:MAG: dihydrofolate reductase family protein [bacterium]